ncbi:MAG: exopolysaccharide biosynthesis protein [Reyranellaceae bacterium]
MSERGALLPTLDRLFAGPRDSLLTVSTILEGLENRSYAFAVAVLNLPNCIPTGIPWLSTITGVPMLLLVGQYFMGRPSPSLPAFIGKRGLQRGKLQDFLGRIRRHLRKLERTIHPRLEMWVSGTPRRLLLLAWTANIFILALPIPFDNLFPAWAALFFCLALIEGDGVMAVLGWLLTLITAAWTVFLLMIGHAAIIGALAALRKVLFD